MELKARYKRTDVGVIPEDWSVTPLHEISNFINGRAYKLTEWEEFGIPVIRLQNLTGGEEYYYSNLELPPKQYCNYGDLLYMWSATFGPHIWNGEKAIYHYHIWKVEPRSGISDRLFLYYKLDEITRELKNRISRGGTMLHVTKESMTKTQIAIPPHSEQRAIASPSAMWMPSSPRWIDSSPRSATSNRPPCRSCSRGRGGYQGLVENGELVNLEK